MRTKNQSYLIVKLSLFESKYHALPISNEMSLHHTKRPIQIQLHNRKFQSKIPQKHKQKKKSDISLII